MLDNREDLSTDATHAMFAYIAMAINVSEMNKLADAMELLRAHVNSEDYEVAQMRGVRKLKDFFSTLGTKYARDYTVSNGQSRIAKEIGRYIDRLVYNETKNELGTMLVGNKEISKDSMFNIFMRLTSISRMGLNPLSGITNATQGETHGGPRLGKERIRQTAFRLHGRIQLC